MRAIIQLLRNEIARLKAELSDLVRRRFELLAPFDVQIADIEQRLQAAETMLATYASPDIEPSTADTRRIGENWRLSSGQSVTSAEPAKLTWPDIERVEIPSSIRGHPLRPNSKRAKIIRATKALLQVIGVANRSEIVEFLRGLDILGKEKNPPSYLSVMLSYSREIFATNGTVWYLRDAEESVDGRRGGCGKPGRPRRIVE